MSTTHTGNSEAISDGVIAPATGPDADVKVRMPVDADPVNAATLFTQQYQELANVEANIIGAMHPRSPITPGPILGFSAVTKIGSGAATVVPVIPSSQTHRGLTFAVKVIDPGAVGVATVQLSTDGGLTYGSTTTTAATVLFPLVSGAITIAFNSGGGNFVAGDIYWFRPAFTPLAVFAGNTGKTGVLFDHNGFPMGRTTIYDETWWGLSGSGNVGGGPVDLTGNKWRLIGEANVGNTYLIGPWGSGYPASAIKLSARAHTDGEIFLLSKDTGLVTKNNDTVLIAEWEMHLDDVNEPTLVQMGWYDSNVDPAASATVKAWFYRPGNTNWFVLTTTENLDTGIAPSANTWQRFKIEIHGSATPVGVANGGKHTGLFFIDEVLYVVTTDSAGLDWSTTPGRFGGGLRHLGTPANAVGLVMGPVRIAFNRFATIPRM